MQFRWPWAKQPVDELPQLFTQEALITFGARLLYALNEINPLPIQEGDEEAAQKLADIIAQSARPIIPNAYEATSLAQRVYEQAMTLSANLVRQKMARYEQRAQLTYEYAISQHRDLLIEARSDWRRRIIEDPDVRGRTRSIILVDIEPPLQFRPLDASDSDIMVRYVEPFLLAALGNDYVEQGAVRAVQHVCDEIAAKGKGMSLADLLEARQAEDVRLQVAITAFENTDADETMH
jgi:hypothetical protein